MIKSSGEPPAALAMRVGGMSLEDYHLALKDAAGLMRSGMSLAVACHLAGISVDCFYEIGGRRLDHVPTPEQIAAATAEIRSRWSPAERASRLESYRRAISTGALGATPPGGPGNRPHPSVSSLAEGGGADHS